MNCLFNIIFYFSLINLSVSSIAVTTIDHRNVVINVNKANPRQLFHFFTLLGYVAALDKSINVNRSVCLRRLKHSKLGSIYQIHVCLLFIYAQVGNTKFEATRLPCMEL